MKKRVLSLCCIAVCLQLVAVAYASSKMMCRISDTSLSCSDIGGTQCGMGMDSCLFCNGNATIGESMCVPVEVESECYGGTTIVNCGTGSKGRCVTNPDTGQSYCISLLMEGNVSCQNIVTQCK